MKSNGASDSHQNNNLKALTSFAHFLGSNVTFYDIKRSDMIKLKSREDDPDRKSIVTWNDYLGRVKYFMRWLYNCKTKGSKESDLLADPVYWETLPLYKSEKRKQSD